MPFALKIPRATYQRLMDKVFKIKSEEHVDDKVVKFEEAKSHAHDLEEITTRNIVIIDGIFPMECFLSEIITLLTKFIDGP